MPRVVGLTIDNIRREYIPAYIIYGLTASPGAGDNPQLELGETLDHFVLLCARMDAYSGIKVVEEHTEELNRYTNKADSMMDVIPAKCRCPCLSYIGM